MLTVFSQNTKLNDVGFLDVVRTVGEISAVSVWEINLKVKFKNTALGQKATSMSIIGT